MAKRAVMELEDDRIVMDVPYTWYDDMRAVPGATYDSYAKRFTLPLGWGSCVIARYVFGKALDVGPRLIEWSQQQKRGWMAEVDRLKAGGPAQLHVYGSDEYRLHDYQEPSANFLEVAQYAVLGDDMRVGKTPAAIVALRNLEPRVDIFPVLIACPPGVKRVWKEHFEMFWPDARVEAPKAGLAAAEKAFKLDPQVLILHYEVYYMLSNLEKWGSEPLKKCQECSPTVLNDKGEEISNNVTAARCQVHPKILNERHWNTVIADEVHRIGEPAALMTRAIKKLSRDSNVRFGLTGTMPYQPDRFWSVMNFVAPFDWPVLGRYRDMFVNKTLNPHSGFYESVDFKLSTRELLDNIFLPRFFRRTKEQVHVDYKEPIREKRYCDMSPKQAKAYKDLQTEYIAMLDNGTFYVDSPLQLMGRLRQLASAFGTVVIDNEGGDEGGAANIVGMRLSEPSGKLDELMSLLQGEFKDQQVVIMAEQRQLVELVEARLNHWRDGCVTTIVGGISDNQRTTRERLFQDGDVQYLAAVVKAGSMGVSYNAADTMIVIQGPYSLEDRKQMEDRIYKEGRASLIIDLITPDTVDERVPRSIATKGQRFEDLVRDADTVREWLKR